MRGNQMTETFADLQIGDQGETLVPLNLRSEIDFKSEIIGSVQDQVLFTVVESGANHRALISSGNSTGWISTKTDLDQPLCKALAKGTGELPAYESLVQLNVHEDMEFKGSVVAVMEPRTLFYVIEQGSQNRYKILVDGEIGWLTGKTNLDQPLVKELGGGDAPKMTKKLDTYVVKMASNAQITKMKSTKSMGGG